MKKSRANLTFVNHASFLIESAGVGLLTDPWYFGSVFNSGWRLLYENTESEIDAILARTSYIWISHEHPDHFSVPFFLKYQSEIIDRKIKIIFQKTRDKRVVNFLSNKGFKVCEVIPGQSFQIAKKFEIKVFKVGFYDSALLINLGGLKILNLNDCPLSEDKNLKKLVKATGELDLLWSQFGYAAWKGGKENTQWRRAAAAEKYCTLLKQAKVFNAKNVVPFASFSYFCTPSNFYMNTDQNSLNEIVSKLSMDTNARIIAVKPLSAFLLDENGSVTSDSDFGALEFWQELKLNARPDRELKGVAMSTLEQEFERYCKRIKKNNSIWFMWLVRCLSFGRVLGVFRVKMIDHDQIVSVDILRGLFEVDRSPNRLWDVALSSNQFNYLISNAFGFDALTVNAEFETAHKNGFEKFVLNFGVEEVNALGLRMDLGLLFRAEILRLLVKLLRKVTRFS